MTPPPCEQLRASADVPARPPPRPAAPPPPSPPRVPLPDRPAPATPARAARPPRPRRPALARVGKERAPAGEALDDEARQIVLEAPIAYGRVPGDQVECRGQALD